MSKEYQEHAGAKDAATLSVAYTYDPSADAGQFTKGLRPTSVRYPNGRLVHFTYGPPDGTNDALDRLAAIHDDDAGSPGQRLAEYTYLGLGTIVVEDYPQPAVKLDYTGEGSYRGFDRFGRIVDQRWIAYGQTPEVVLDRYTYQYDRAGNRTRRTNELNHAFDETYGYDRINRLVSAARADGFAQSWTLDALGNFPQFDDDGNLQTRTANPVNEITAITAGWITPAYDAAGNLTSGPVPGSETTRVHYHYDAWNRLVRVYADGSQNPGQPGDLVAQYVYDGTNRRIKKTVTEEGGGPRHVHYYYNHDWQLLEERFVDGQGAMVASNQYVWSARYLGALIVRFHDGNGDGDYLDAEDNVRYSTTDANYNVTATIDASTGEVIERYVYTAYGKATVYDEDWANPAGSMTDGPLYCGYLFDAESGLYHVRNRYYDSRLSTFISRDPIGFQGRDSNLYRYVAGNPERATDPSGLSILTYISILGTIECFLTTYPGTSLGDYDSILTGGLTPSKRDCCSPEPADKEKAITQCQNAVKGLASRYTLNVGLAYGVHIFSDVVGILAGIAVGGPIGIVVGGVAAIDGIAAAWCVVDAARDIKAMADFAEANFCVC